MATIKESGKSLTNQFMQRGGFADAPSLIRQYFHSTSAATQGLIGALDGAGIPQTSDGANAQREVIKAFSDYQQALTGIIASLGAGGAIQGSGPMDAQRIKDANKTASQNLRNAVNDLKASSSQLGQSFSQSPSCRALEDAVKGNSSVS